MRQTQLGLMSYPDIAAIDKSYAVLLVPIGCVEQHGPAGYTNADTLFATYVCREAAAALDNVYIAPELAYGYTPYTAFAGTVSLRLETLQAVVRDVIEGYIAHGFKHICVVNNHGPNEAAIEPVAAKVRKEHGVILSILYPWKLASPLSADLYENPKAVSGHGGEPTISVMMALNPGVVNLDRAGKQGYVSPPGPIQIASYRGARFAGQEVGLFNEASTVLPLGASGDWTVASEEKGQIVLQRLVDFAVQFIPAFREFSQNAQTGE
jgi:creatinine amidohydrolase